MKILVFKMLLAVFLLTACVHYYRSDYRGITPDGLVVIEIKGEIEMGETKSVYEARAIGIVLEDSEILALTHSTSIPRERTISTTFGTLVIPLKIIEEKIYVNNVEVSVIKRSGDITLLQGKNLKPFPFKFGDSDKLQVGDRVAVIGFSLTRAFNFKDGVVALLDVGKIYGEVEHPIMLISIPINPGDSGSPLLAFRYGEPFIVGIVNAAIQDKGMGFAIKINDVKKIIGR